VPGITGLLPVLLALVLLAPQPATPPTPTLELDVIASHLVDQHRRPVQLRGLNRSGAEYACVQGWGIFDGPADQRSVAVMRSWGTNAVRIPLNEDCWLGGSDLDASVSGPAYRAAISNYVSLLGRSGMVAILDLHWTGTAGERATGQRPMPDGERSRAFWDSVARTFSASQSVVFDVFNEPHDVSWQCWRDGCDGNAGMQDLVDTIRETGATQPIIISGLDWGGDLRGWLVHRPDDPLGSLIAGVHLYDFKRCNTIECWESELGPIAEISPVVITEFGDTDCDGDFSSRLMEWADTARISYLAWSWNTAQCDGGPAVITSYDGTPSPFGEVVRSHFTNPPSLSGARPIPYGPLDPTLTPE
jgi:endoglucanase